MSERMVRLGVLVPATNTTMEPEMSKMAPKSVTVHFERLIPASRALITAPSPEERLAAVARFLTELDEDAPRAAQAVAMIHPKVIGFGCTSGSFHKGAEYEKKLVENIEAATHIPTISTSGAVIQALKELGLKKVGMVTPYPDFVNSLEEEFLRANGVEVSVMRGLQLELLEINEQPPQVARDLAINTCRGADCDGVFCSCTAFRTIEIIEEVEKELGKPMISSNQATMWLMLKRAGIKKPVSGFGRLLTQL